MNSALINKALWSKAVRDGWRLFLGLATLLFAFHWLYVWSTSLVKLDALSTFLKGGMVKPEMVEDLLGIPIDTFATVTGRIAMAFVDPVALFCAVSWGIARGSDCVSGEIGRGTMEMLLGQPVRRIEILASQACVTIGGALLLSLFAWLGTCVGISLNDIGDEVEPARFLPGAFNFFGLMVFLAGVTALVSSFDVYRWRTIGIVGAFYMVELVIKVIGRLVHKLDWLLYTTFLGAYEPQRMVVVQDHPWTMAWQYTGTLLGLGLVAYGLAAFVFCRRDLPAPL